jgi:hypothetical protein
MEMRSSSVRMSHQGVVQSNLRREVHFNRILALVDKRTVFSSLAATQDLVTHFFIALELLFKLTIFNGFLDMDGHIIDQSVSAFQRSNLLRLAIDLVILRRGHKTKLLDTVACDDKSIQNTPIKNGFDLYFFVSNLRVIGAQRL